MSTTVSSYLNNIGAGSAEYPLAQQILGLITIAAGTTGAASGARSQLPSLINQMVHTLVANDRFSGATILALIAAATASGGKTLPDVGCTGTVAVSGSAITVTSGNY